MSGSNQLNAPVLNTNAVPIDPADIEHNGMIRHPVYGDVRARIGPTLSLHFFEGWKPEKRAAMIAIAREYVSFLGDGVRRMQTEGRRAPLFRSDSLDTFSEKEFYFSLQGHDGNNTYDMNNHFLVAFGFGKNDLSRKLSGIRVYFPPRFYWNDPDSFVALIAKWAGMLGAAHGVAGYGIQSAPSIVISDGVIEYLALMAYRGLDMDDLGAFWTEIDPKYYDRLRVSNWLTLLGDDFVQRLGGLPAVARQVSGEVSLVTYAGGILFRAGRYPILGESRPTPAEEPNRTVARIIRLLRHEDYWGDLFAVPEGQSAKDATLAWVRRFD